MPAQPLLVSAGHGLFIDGVLVPAGLLVNNVSITRAAFAQVDYYHFDLGTQEMLWVEDCAAESFAGEALRGRFQNAAEYALLYPDAPPVALWLTHTLQGFALDAIRTRLEARAGLMRPARPAGPLRGFIDIAGPGQVAGWAQWEGTPELPVCLEIWRDETRLARVLANLERADLHAAGLGSGRHGFELALPPGSGAIRVRTMQGKDLPLTGAAQAARAA